MPCYEPPLPHQRRLQEFLTAALCHATSRLSPEDLASFPGLAAWKERHDRLDAVEGTLAKLDALREIGEGPYDAPEFMKQLMAAFPMEASTL